jgi:hypothetical protein
VTFVGANPKPDVLGPFTAVRSDFWPASSGRRSFEELDQKLYHVFEGDAPVGR